MISSGVRLFLAILLAFTASTHCKAGVFQPAAANFLDPNFASAVGTWSDTVQEVRTTIVHLFEWRWLDIANECETLGPKNYGGIQTSPPNENLVINDIDGTDKRRPWFERYQPVSYLMTTRSGTYDEYVEMVTRCNAAGVRIYADIVMNHMTGCSQPEGNSRGTAGSTFNASTCWWSDAPISYPGGVGNGAETGSSGYQTEHFHDWRQCHTYTGTIENYADRWQVRNCKLSYLNDLNQGHPFVRSKVVEFMNLLIDIGVAGFRIDAAKHMDPFDLNEIYNSLKPLNMEAFGPGRKPYIYQEVIDRGGEAIQAREYNDQAAVTEFKYSYAIGSVFLKQWNAAGTDRQKLRYLRNFARVGLDWWGNSLGWGFMESSKALVFVDNHDNQRGHGGGNGVVTFRKPREYKTAMAFMLACPYGTTQLMSSYFWEENYVWIYRDWQWVHEDENNWMGPPIKQPVSTRLDSVNKYETLEVIDEPPELRTTLDSKQDFEFCETCKNKWVAEHRWPEIERMVRFRNVFKAHEPAYSDMSNWWDNGSNQISFSLGNRAFIAFNTEESNDPRQNIIRTNLQTGLEPGMYCNVILGDRNTDGTICDGNADPIVVCPNGIAHIEIDNNNHTIIPVVAIHLGSKLARDLTHAEDTNCAGLIAEMYFW